MGINGLNTFFDNNPHLSRPYGLHHTKVIIDGNNLANVLYFGRGVDCVHGGDYNRYATHVKNYFRLYLRCSIEPIVIFDGGYDRTDSKLRTVIQRANRRLKCAVRISKQLASTGHVLPVFAIRVFMDVVEEMGIQYAQCPFEADYEITAIANHFKCPVISSDSDFYIFDVTHGFIRLDSIDLKVRKGKDHRGQPYCFLHCMIYRRSIFLSLFPGIKKCVLPLFSTLMGNDFSDPFVFNVFFCHVEFPKAEFMNLVINERHEQMIRLLLWLKQHDVISATREVLNHMKEEKRERVKKLIEQAIDAYRFEKSDFVNYFDCRPSAYTNNVVTNFYTFNNSPLPSWFSSYFYKADLCPFVLNAVGLHRVFLQTHVEDISLDSTYTCSLYIRQVLYGLLLSLDNVSENNASENCIKEYDRVEETLQQSFVKPIFTLKGFGTLPKLCEKQFDTETSQLIVLHTLGEKHRLLQGLPDFLHLFVMSVRYYLRNSTPKPSEDFIDALLLATIYLSIAEPLIQKHFKRSGDDALDCQKFSYEDFRNIPILHISENVTPSNAFFLKRTLKANLQRPRHKKGKHLILPILHGYGQLQGCLNFTIMLNELVGSPFKTPRVQYLLNGPLTYSLTKEMMEQKFPNSFLHEVLGPDSILDHLFRKLKKKVLKNLAVDCLKWRNQKSRRPCPTNWKNDKGSAKHLQNPVRKTSVVGVFNKFDVLKHSSRASSSGNMFI